MWQRRTRRPTARTGSGRKSRSRYTKLILKDTIEENLLKLQNAKLALAAQVVSEGMVSLGDLSQNELMELFEQNP